MSGEDRPPADLAEDRDIQKALRAAAILRELADILNSSLDLEKILQQFVQRTTELCNVTRCAVWLLEEAWNRFRPVTYHMSAPVFTAQMLKTADAIWHRSPLPMNNPVIQRLLAAGGMLTVTDLRAEPGVQIFAEKFQAHSTLLIALVRNGRPVGIMSLDDPGQTRSFSPEQQELARMIGQQATIAIDNARLYQHAQEQQLRAEHLIERAQAIYQVAKTVNSGEALPVVLELATKHLVHVLEASGGLAFLLEPDGSTLSPAGVIQEEMGLSLKQLPNIEAAIHVSKPTLVTAELATGQEHSWFQPFNRLKSILLVPLMGGTPQDGANWDLPEISSTSVSVLEEERPSLEAHCVGLIAIHYTRRRKPTTGEYAFAQDIATQCALAIEKARLLTEARQAAELATERANTLDAVFQAMTEGIMVITPDAEIFIRNNAAARFLGIPVYSGAPLETFLQQHPAYTLEGDLLSYEEFPLTRALQGKTSMRGERVVMTRADKTRRVIEITATPLRDTNRQQVGLVSAFRDITIQTQAEQRIRGALETFLHISEAVSRSTNTREILYSVLAKILVPLHCPRGMVYLFQHSQQTFSPLIKLGFTNDEEELWQEQQQIWLNPESEQNYGFLAQLLEGQTILIDAEHCPAQPNPFLHTRVLAAPITHNQQMLGLILLDRSLSPSTPGQPQTSSHFTSWDMTIVEGIAQLAGVAMEQVHWQEEAILAQANEAAMHKANEMKDEFLAITAHEFRSPLAVILARSQGSLRALRRAASAEMPSLDILSTVVEEHLEIISAQAKQLNNIVTTFLDAARMNQGQFALKTEMVDLGKIVRQVVENQVSLGGQYKIRSIIRNAQKPYLVQGDQARLAQIIANLVENAIKYSPPGGSVSVILRRQRRGKMPANVEVCVADKGMGIPVDAQTRLFERFYRVPSTISSETRGVGLGLYIVAQLVHLHGGQIHVESSGIPGEGSRFIFTLPTLTTLPENTLLNTTET
jgi:PAS domain S-box-containing protein